MTWGVGTGRCGTKLLSNIIGAEHEPMPRIVEEATKYFQECYTGGLLTKLQERLDKYDSVVDHKCSLVIPAILQIDPSAKFIWLIRKPTNCVSSCLNINMYRRKKGDHWDSNRLAPKEGFPEYYTELEKNIWRYWAINQEIAHQLQFIDRSRWEIQKSEELEGWAETGPHDNGLSACQREVVSETLGPCYNKWLTF